MSRLTKPRLIGIAVLLMGFSGSGRAAACGGFFCSQQSPVNQSQERIIFSHNGDGTTTAIIQILYQGPSESFAWVLPVTGLPEVGVSSDTAFALLQQRTDPQYNLERKIEGECKPDPVPDYGFGAPTASLDESRDTTSEQQGVDDPVVVVGAGDVGPYNWVVISVVPEAEDKVDVALEWLADNDYDVTSLGPEVLRPYLDEGLNLLAFKLTKEDSAGSIRPVMLTYESDSPTIPIRPTAVAAENDMGVLTWVLGETQAIPNNYLSLVINEAAINWFNWRSNYNEVISAAADESGGQGFVTELAGPTQNLASLVFTETDVAAWADVSDQVYATGYDAIEYAQRYYRNWQGWRDAIGAATTLPAGVTLDDFGRNPDAYRDDPELQIDTAVFLEQLYDLVVGPMERTQQVLDSRPYITRLYTTMSASEMTLDPSFDFNPDLADVNNVHRATQIISCNKDLYASQAPFVIEIPGFGTIEGDPSQVGVWPITIGEDMPATKKIVALSTSGAGEVVVDNSADIYETLGTETVPNDTENTDPDLGLPIGGADEEKPMMASDDPTQVDDDTTSVDDKPNTKLGDDNDTDGSEEGVKEGAKDSTSGLDDEGVSKMAADMDDDSASDSAGFCAVVSPAKPSDMPGSLGLLSLLGVAAFTRRRNSRVA